jgi:hypothetical protein
VKLHSHSRGAIRFRNEEKGPADGRSPPLDIRSLVTPVLSMCLLRLAEGF